MSAVRLITVVLALAGAAWFTIAAGSAATQDRIVALAVAEDTPSQADLETARRLLPRAQRLNPDTRAEQAVGVLELRTGDRAAATKTFRRLTEQEPRSAELWALLGRAADGYDPALSARAAARARSLAPPVRQ